MIKAIYRKLDDYFFNSSIQKARQYDVKLKMSVIRHTHLAKDI